MPRWVSLSLSLVLAGCGGSASQDDEAGSASSESDDASGSNGSNGSESASGSESGTSESGTSESSTSESSTSESSTGESSTSESSSSESSTDTSGETTSESGDTTTTDSGGDELPLWLLSVDEPGGNVHALVRISLAPGEEGTTTVICPDLLLPASLPANSAFTSLTFNANVLYASAQDDANGDTLVIIDPCVCEVTEVGKYGFSLVNGITSNAGQVMFGLSAQSDVIIDIDPQTATGTQLTMLGANWGSHGLSWSDEQLNLLYGINASTDRLHTFDGADASELGSIMLDVDFASVGLELHPGLATLYACGVAGQTTDLFAIDVDTGTVSQVAATGLVAGCDNLGAPFGPVECIPQ
jgi:hypothetical protein